jgi:tRNA A37 N6-isopentenylltransferase MiaA
LTGRLFVISGPTAAGKTTVGRALADRLPRASESAAEIVHRIDETTVSIEDLRPRL